MKLVAIVGKKRVGKDTCADYIASLRDGSTIYRLATPIKQVMFSTRPVKLLKLTFDDFDGNGIDREIPLDITTYEVFEWIKRCLNELFKNKDIKHKFDDVARVVSEIAINENQKWSIRLLMTTLGTDIVVNLYNKSFWIDLFLETYLDNKDKSGYFIIPDIRQETEIAMMREMGARLIHIKRETGLVSTHITERGLIPLDNEPVIINNGTLEDFYKKIYDVL